MKYYLHFLILAGLCLIPADAFADYPPPPQWLQQDIQQNLEEYLTQTFDTTALTVEEVENEPGSMVSYYYSSVLDGVVIVQDIPEGSKFILNPSAVQTQGSSFVDNQDGTYFVELVTLKDFIDGIRPEGWVLLPVAMQGIYYQNLVSGEIVSDQTGTKVYVVPDGGTCKQKELDTQLRMPGGRNGFLHNTTRRQARNPITNSLQPWWRTTRTNVDRVKVKIKSQGSFCCRIKISGTFNMPSNEVPLIAGGTTAGSSSITTQMYDCNNQNFVNGQIDGNNLGNPTSTGPIHVVDWATASYHQGANQNYYSTSGDFILEVPCGECKIVKFTINSRNSTYTILVAMSCEFINCHNYDWGL